MLTAASAACVQSELMMAHGAMRGHARRVALKGGLTDCLQRCLEAIFVAAPRDARGQ